MSEEEEKKKPVVKPKPPVDMDFDSDDAEIAVPDEAKPNLVHKENEPTAKEVESKERAEKAASKSHHTREVSRAHGHGHHHHHSHSRSYHHHHRSRSRSHYHHHHHHSRSRSGSRSRSRSSSRSSSRSRSRSHRHHHHSHSRHHHSSHHGGHHSGHHSSHYHSSKRRDDRRSTARKDTKKDKDRDRKEEVDKKIVEKKKDEEVKKVENKEEEVENKEEVAKPEEEKKVEEPPKAEEEKKESQEKQEGEEGSSGSESGSESASEGAEGSKKGSGSSGSSSSVDSETEVLNEMKGHTLLDMYKQNDKKQMQKLFTLLGEVNGLKKDVARVGKMNFQLTTDIAALEKKISLLIKNRLTPEEVLEAKGAIMEVRDKIVTLPDRSLYERYGRLLYLLRTRTVYLSRLARSIKLGEMDNFLQTVMFTLYGNQYEEDEEHLLLTMFKNVLFDDFNNASAMTEILRANTPLTRMLTTYTRRDPGQQYLKQTLSAILTEVCTDKECNLEIDPKRIFEAWVNDYEVNQGMPYEGERNPDSNVCLQFAFVKMAIDERIPKLVSVIERIVATLANSVDMVPYGIRFICRHIKQLIMAKYPDLTMTQVCGFVGGFFMLRFINPAIATPNAHMLVEPKLDAVGRRNVTIIAKILQNLSNNVAFGGVKEAYMEVLNPLMYNSWTMLNAFLDNLTKVQDLEQRLAVDQYKTFTKFSESTFTKFSEPIVTISLNELYYVHQLLVKYKDRVFTGLDNDEVMSILNSFPSVPEQVPRTENGNVEIRLITVSKREDQQPSVLELEQLFNELKYQVFRVMRYLPASAESRFTDTDVMAFLTAVQKWSCDSGNGEVLGMMNDIMAKLKILLVHEVLRESDNCSRLRHDFASDVLHVDARIRRTQATIVRLKDVLKQLQEAHSFAEQQMAMYREYLDNVRVAATLVVREETSKKDRRKSKVLGKGGDSLVPEVHLSHSQLVKDGVIIHCTLPEKLMSHISYDVTPVASVSGAYQIIPYAGKKKLEDHVVVVHLEELLERQSLNEVEFEYGPFVLQVNMLIRLINKNFLSG